MDNGIFSDKHLLAEMDRYTRLKHVKRDSVILSPGDPVVFLPIVKTGVLRIIRQNEEGKEIFLYHLYPGQTCALAINCCQRHAKSIVKAIAEEDTDILLVPAERVEDWFRHDEWRLFINSTYSTRFSELVDVIDLIAFHHMDKQVLHYLRERAKAAGSSTIFITHQNIADELHTHREAISRLLRTMEDKNIVKLGRNTIELLES